MYRVAVCDDNREILNEIGRMLEDTTEEISDVDLYASAQELENIYTEHGQYDIILMDILLEQENGISLARRIQDQYPGYFLYGVSGAGREYLWSQSGRFSGQAY